MAEKIQFFPLDITYKVINEKAVIYLYGRTVEGEKICVTDYNFEPYFYVIPKKTQKVLEKLEKVKVERGKEVSQVVKTETVNKKYLGNNVEAIKVYTRIPSDVPVIREEIKSWSDVESVHEYDIHFLTKYLIDKGVIPTTIVDAEGDFVTEKSKVPVFRADNIKQFSDEALKKPKILAFDIETYNPTGKAVLPEENPIIMLSFYGEKIKKVFTWKKFKTKEGYIEFVNSEVELIQKFKDTIEDYKPDIITGYFSDGFDLPYIIARAEKYKIKLDMGYDFSELRIGKGKRSNPKVTGIVHIDLFKFIRKIIGRGMETESYSLNAVAQELLGEKKQDVDLDELAEVWDKKTERIEEFCKYNMHDSVLTFKLFEKILPNLIELVKIVGLPLYDVNRMSFSQLVEGYLLRQAPNFGEIAPNRPHYDEIGRRRLQTYKGAFVYEPKPGLYDDIVVFDYRSLYPTIISSHNISPGTICCSCCESDAKPAPTEDKKKYWFCKKRKGFIATIIEDLITRRTRIKEIIKEEGRNVFLDARENSLKLLANSFYGYLGFFGARWYSIECAKSVTAWGRFYIHKVIDKAKKDDFRVIYSDSLPYDRYIYVKFKKGDIKLVKIGELYDNFRNISGLSTLALDKNRKVVFKPIVGVIRHRYKGKLLNINTRYGSTIVTPQHSLYSFDNKSQNICLVNAKRLKKGDKLISLTNPELRVTYKKSKVFDILDFDMGPYSKELVLYSDNLFFPRKKGECPYCKKEYILSSHVNLKHPERRQPLDKKSLFSWVGGKNAKTRKIPRNWRLDKDLAWILGFYCAEGSVSDVATKSGRKALLSFGSQNKKTIYRVKEILDSKTNVSTKIIENVDKRTGKKMFYYRVQCIPIVALFQYGFDAGKGSEFKKVPWFIFTAEESLRNAFVRGYLDGDGQLFKDKRYATHFIRFSTKSKELAMGLDFIFKSLKYPSNFQGKEIKHVAWQYRNDKPKIQTLRIQSAKESKGNFCLAKIRSIKEMPNEKCVYDVEVKGTHNFVDSEGMILVHNTDSVFLTLDGKHKKDVDKFAESINIELPGLMELEYEGFYPRGIFVSAKEGPYGAKKKYALLSEDNELKIRGFETVRRNWSFIAKDVQENVLKIILKEKKIEKALEYVKKVINELREKQIPLDKVVIHTQLKKEIKDYDSVGPHVKVAMRMKKQGIAVGPGSMIKFIVIKGDGRIGDRSRLPEEVKKEEYDADYYIKNQVIPSVDRIFDVLGYSKEELIESKGQKKLGKFLK